jgi:tetratricopeptide (TPR) repeat protein
MLRVIYFFLILTQIAQAAQQPAKPSGTPTPSAVTPAQAKTAANADGVRPSPPPTPVASESAVPGSDEDFRAKLSESVQKIEKSIKLIRQQITESQNAPFLPDLYVQLGDLLSQKSITLYYIKMEHDHGVSSGSVSDKDKAFAPVISAQKEAIEIYKLVLHDFPTYQKRSEVTYKLALSLKAIDEVPEFIKTASQLIKDYPGSQDAMRANLLLGRHFLDGKDFDEAYTFLKPIADSSYNYEKNLARYWIGLIDLGREKYVDALHSFEMVVNDPDLKEQENPYELKKSGTGKNDLKREALIDSIRAYTIVYEKNPDPVGYYSKLCPTEAYFQETMEKLALRYIFLKKYNDAVRLLRSTSERVADPQKVINVYREVLLMIPLQDRISIPADEMRFVLAKFNSWQSYFNIPIKTQSDAYWFFEKQIRDLGTRAHDLVKTEKDPTKRAFYLERSRDYYLLYLSYFDNTQNAVKIASDLADVYYLQGDYYESGDYYLKIFLGNYGKSPERKAIIENAILALQKDNSQTFYEKVRAKGLLIKAIKSYQALNPALKNDPKLGLLLLKTEYEQGFLPETLDALYAFMKVHGREKQAVDAGEMILDYFNTRNDFTGLGFWADRLLSLKLPQPDFNAKLGRMKLQAKNKVLQEKVHAVAGYDEFAEGKSYLTVALNAGDAATKNAVLQEALAKSKRERDLATFLEAAQLIADKEPNPQKKAEILLSIAHESVKVGRYYFAIREYKTIFGNPSFDVKTRTDALEDQINTELLLHDLTSLTQAMREPLFDKISSATKNRVRELLSDSLDSPIDAPDALVGGDFRLGLTEDTFLSLYKGRNKMSAASAARVLTEIRSRCGVDSRQAACRWLAFENLEGTFAGTVQFLGTAPATLKSLEGVASRYMATVAKYQALESSTDSHLETALSLREKALYQYFAAYLTRVANANPELRNDIIQKAREAQATAATYQQKCNMIVAKAAGVNPAMKFCTTTQNPPFKAFLTWTGVSVASASRSDPTSDKITDLQKGLFAGTTDADPLLNLAHEYYVAQNYYHSAALAAYGAATFKDRQHDFQAILGCSVLSLGFLNEAGYHLKDATDYLALRTQCYQRLQGLRVK